LVLKILAPNDRYFSALFIFLKARKICPRNNFLPRLLRPHPRSDISL
jgi:hypothetical protein